MRLSAGVGTQKVYGDLSNAVHEACADWADDGFGDVKADGMVHIHTHNQNPQALRGEIAKMMGTTADHVIVHSYPGPGITEGQTEETRGLKTRR